MPDDASVDRALNDLILAASEHSLLDDYTFDDGSVHLAVGTFEIYLDYRSAIDFLQGLLTAYDRARSLGENS